MAHRILASVGVALGGLLLGVPLRADSEARRMGPSILFESVSPGREDLDTVRLRNGSILRGRVVRFENGEFTMVLTGTQSRAIIHVADVESIEFGGGSGAAPSKEEAAERASGDRSRGETGAPPRVSDSSKIPAETPASVPQYTERTVRVPANEVWTDTGIDVVKGQKIRLAASGRVSISRTRTVGPEGVEMNDPNKLMVDLPSGGLIAVIGEDNDDFLFIGPAAELVAHRSGRLFLMVNDSALEDNSGEFLVRIQVGEPPQKKP